MIPLDDILFRTGPLISGDLAREFSKINKKSLDASKKIISRAKSPIQKLKLGFNKNQSFVYHDYQYRKPEYWESVETAILKHAGAVSDILNAFYFHSGYMYKDHLPAYCSSPIKTLSSRPKINAFLDILIEEEFISYFDADTYRISDDLFKSDNFNRFKWIEKLKMQVAEDFILMISKLNMVSFGSNKIIDNTPEFGNLQWCFTCPSYLQSLRSTDGSKPGFIVGDILLGRKVTQKDIKFFISKIGILRSRKRLRSFIPILVCDYVDPEAFKTLKSNGVIIALIQEVFGTQYSESLRLLLETLTNATSVISENPDKIFDLAKSISVLKGKFGNIKGDLFELVVGYYYSLKGEPIVIGKTITDRESGKSKEIDVFINNRDHVRFVECKSYNEPMTKEHVIEWLNKIPIIKDWMKYQDELSNKTICLELWSTSGFDEEAEEHLQNRKESLSKYSLEYLGKSEIQSKFKSINNKKLKDLLNSYFGENSITS